MIDKPVIAAYGLDGDTPILLWDGSQKPIRDVMVGDLLRGYPAQTKKHGGEIDLYKPCATAVVAVLKTTGEAIKIPMNKRGPEVFPLIICAPAQRWYNGRAFLPAEQQGKPRKRVGKREIEIEGGADVEDGLEDENTIARVRSVDHLIWHDPLCFVKPQFDQHPPAKWRLGGMPLYCVVTTVGNFVAGGYVCAGVTEREEGSPLLTGELKR